MPENPASYRVVRTKSYLFNKASSLHAGSPRECISGLIDRCYEHPACRGMPVDVLLRKVLHCVDVIVSVDVHGNVRRMSDVYFKPLHMQAMKESFNDAA